MIDEFIWEMAWRRALVIAFLEIATVVFAGYLVLIVQFFRKGIASVGILCSFCLIPCFLPAGVPIALIFGWWGASRWGMRAFMGLWTAAVALALLNVIAIFVLRSLDAATLRLLFR